ncbi:MAG: hypothetical protein LUE89_00385 [Clostridiales bacterium]|nr:hypothetical protein [Clostridiales bacterium]
MVWAILDRAQEWAQTWVFPWFRLARYFWREIIACIPLFTLFTLGERGAEPAAFAWCLVLLLLLVLALNPGGVFYNVLAPATRFCAAAGLALVLCAVALAWLSFYGRFCLALLGAALLALAWWKRKPWLLSWQVLQAPEVDEVLSHLAHGGEWEAGQEWERNGCRQTRALLHQALNMEVNEAEIDRAYKAVYLLALVHGMEKQQKTVDRLKKDLKAAQDEGEEWRQTAICRADNTEELESVTRQRDRLETQLREAQDQARRYRKEAETWRPQEAEENQEAAILAYLEAGHSYQETAAAFGTNKTKVWRLARQQEGGEQ